MKAYAHIIEELDHSLEVLEVEIDDVTELAEAGIKLTKKTLKSIRGLVVDKEFDSKADEICFFKETKPRIYSKLIYYVNLFNIESKRPKSSNDNQIKYFNDHIDRLQQYLNDNLDFYHYYRRGGVALPLLGHR